MDETQVYLVPMTGKQIADTHDAVVSQWMLNRQLFERTSVVDFQYEAIRLLELVLSIHRFQCEAALKVDPIAVMKDSLQKSYRSDFNYS